MGAAAAFGLWMVYYNTFDRLIKDKKETADMFQEWADREQQRYQWYRDRKYND